MGKYNFDEALAIGHKFEKLAIGILEKEGSIIKERCNDSRYDILTVDKEDNTIQTKYEVKADLRGNTTGNMYIEFNYKGKPSGIETTESKYWWIFLKEDLSYKFKTDNIKQAIEDKKYFTIANCGNETKGYLFKKNILLGYL